MTSDEHDPSSRTGRDAGWSLTIGDMGIGTEDKEAAGPQRRRKRSRADRQTVVRNRRMWLKTTK